MTQMLNKGEIWLANLNPGRGTEPGKMRPVLVVQDQALLEAKHPSTLIIPLTTVLIEDAAPLRFRITARDRLKQNSDLLIDQIRAIDNKRLLEGPLALLSNDILKRVYKAVSEVMGMA